MGAVVWVGRFSNNVTCDDDFQENWTQLYKAGTSWTEYLESTPAPISCDTKKTEDVWSFQHTHNGKFRGFMSNVMSFIQIHLMFAYMFA